MLYDQTEGTVTWVEVAPHGVIALPVLILYQALKSTFLSYSILSHITFYPNAHAYYTGIRLLDPSVPLLLHLIPLLSSQAPFLPSFLSLSCLSLSPSFTLPSYLPPHHPFPVPVSVPVPSYRWLS